MTIQEAREFFAGSDFSPETKQKIAEVLRERTVLDPNAVLMIKQLMQQELNKDFAEAGVDVSDDPKAQEIENEYQSGLEKIEKDMDDDLAFVESELEVLDTIRKSVMAASDAADADAIRKSI